MAYVEGFCPISDFLLVKMHPVDAAAVILLTPNAGRDAVPMWGTAVECGPGLTLPSGTVAEMPCEVDDDVMLQINAGTEVTLDGEKFRIVPARDLFGVRFRRDSELEDG
jgi:co-chaperonin GroES (HSP10)